jgi:hypothetical protein
MSPEVEAEACAEPTKFCLDNNFVEAARGARRASTGIENCDGADMLPVEELAVEGNSAPAVRAQTFAVAPDEDRPR